MDGRLLDQVELLTVAEKEEQYYRHWLGDTIQELAQQCLGVRRWIQFRNTITVLSRLGYFATTTLSNLATPGEEFCDAQAAQKQPLGTKALMVLMNNDLQLPTEIPRPYANLVKDVHLITFFLFGDYYELAKRITNFSYISQDTTRTQSQNVSHLYRFLGLLSLVKLFIHVTELPHEPSDDVQFITSPTKSSETAQLVPLASKSHDPAMVCYLCSNQRIEPTSTICGHIFCWHCIHEWLKSRPECPTCRTPTEPSRLIHLINFR